MKCVGGKKKTLWRQMITYHFSLGFFPVRDPLRIQWRLKPETLGLPLSGSPTHCAVFVLKCQAAVFHSSIMSHLDGTVQTVKSVAKVGSTHS